MARRTLTDETKAWHAQLQSAGLGVVIDAVGQDLATLTRRGHQASHRIGEAPNFTPRHHVSVTACGLGTIGSLVARRRAVVGFFLRGPFLLGGRLSLETTAFSKGWNAQTHKEAVARLQADPLVVAAIHEAVDHRGLRSLAIAADLRLRLEFASSISYHDVEAGGPAVLVHEHRRVLDNALELAIALDRVAPLEESESLGTSAPSGAPVGLGFRSDA